MKKTTWFLAVLAVVVLAVGGTGCKKQDASQQQPKTIEDGVVQLRLALAEANPQIRKDLYEGVEFGVRYGNYMQSMMALDKIANDPSLNEQQKKLANTVLELFKQKLQTPAAPPRPAQ